MMRLAIIIFTVAFVPLGHGLRHSSCHAQPALKVKEDEQGNFMRDLIEEAISHMLLLVDLPVRIGKLTPPYQALALDLLIDPYTGEARSDGSGSLLEVQRALVATEQETYGFSGIKSFLKTAFVTVLLTTGLGGVGVEMGANRNVTGLSQSTSLLHNQTLLAHAVEAQYGLTDWTSAEIAGMYKCSDSSCLDRTWAEVVDQQPLPPLSTLKEDFTQLVQSSVSGSTNIKTGMRAAENLVRAAGQVPREGDAFDRVTKLGKAPCQGRSCYEDPDFPPPRRGQVDHWSGPGHGGPGVEFEPGTWRRATEWSLKWNRLAEKGALLLDGATAADVRQGGIGDCWFLAGIAAAAETDISILNDIFVTKNHNVEGFYELRFWLNGQWVQATVDDYLPGNAKGEWTPARASPQHQGKLWVTLVEKAYAKIFGSYGALAGGWGNVAIRDLSARPVQYIHFNNLPANRPDVEQLKDWSKFALRGGRPRFLESNFRELMEARLNDVGQAEAYVPSSTKIVQQLIEGAVASTSANGHCYSVLETKIVGQNTFLKIRNPWGSTDIYDGVWSDQDPIWSTPRGRKLRAALGGLSVDSNDGLFWLEWGALRRWAESLNIARDSEFILGVDLEPDYSHNNRSWGKAFRLKPFVVKPPRAGETLTISIANSRHATTPGLVPADSDMVWAAVDAKNPNGSWRRVVQKSIRQQMVTQRHYLYLRVENVPAEEMRVTIDVSRPGMRKNDQVFAAAYVTKGTQLDQVQRLRAVLQGGAALDEVVDQLW